MLLSFKEFLQETLTSSQEHEYRRYSMLPNARKATDHFFGKDLDDIRQEVPGINDKKSDTHKAIENHLGIEIPIEDYRANLHTNEKGNRQKITRAIKDPILTKQFEQDPARFGSGKMGNLYATHHRGLNVADQTNHDQAWNKESCKSIDPDCLGSNHSYIPDEIKHGTVVSFLRDENGKQIARATFQPHHNGQHTIYKLESQYGLRHPAWSKHLEDTEKKLSGAWKPGMPIEYEKNPNVYNDNKGWTAQHPNITGEQLDSLYELHKHTNPKKILETIAKHPNTNKETLSKIIQERGISEETRHAYGNKNLDPKEIDNGLASNDKKIIEELAKHPKLNKDHVKTIYNTNISNALSNLASNGAIGHELLDHFTQHEDPFVRKAAMDNPLATIEHYKKGLKDLNYISNRALNGINKMVNTPKGLKEVMRHVTDPNVDDRFFRSVVNYTPLPRPHLESLLNLPNLSKERKDAIRKRITERFKNRGQQFNDLHV